MHLNIVTNLWAQCECYIVPPPFYNKLRDTPTIHFPTVPTLPPPTVPTPSHLCDVNIHKTVRYSLPPIKYTYYRCPYLSPTPPLKINCSRIKFTGSGL